ISPRLAESVERSRYQVGAGEAADSSSSAGASSGAADEPRWDWETRFLWTGVGGIPKKMGGGPPGGVRGKRQGTEGSFVGPGLEAVVLPGAADWMRIRQDGIANVNVIEVLQTRTGVRLYCTYGGMFDLGADGYDRALRGEFDPLPPFVVAPTYTTA